MHLLETTGLMKTYGKKCVVESVDINVKRSEVVGLLGPNGAGGENRSFGKEHPLGAGLESRENRSGIPLRAKPGGEAAHRHCRNLEKHGENHHGSPFAGSCGHSAYIADYQSPRQSQRRS